MLRPGALPLVYNVIGRSAESDLDVDDIVQDTMVAVIRALPELRETAKFRSWLVAIAVRQLTDARRRVRSGRLTTLEHAEERNAPEPDFATLFLLRQSLTAEQRQVATATAWLDPSYRDLLSRAVGLMTTMQSTISMPAHCSSDQESYCSALICERIHAGATISAVMAYLLRGASAVPVLLEPASVRRCRAAGYRQRTPVPPAASYLAPWRSRVVRAGARGWGAWPTD